MKFIIPCLNRFYFVGRLHITGCYHGKCHEIFREHSPNFIGVADVGFGADCVVFKSNDNRLYYERFCDDVKMFEVKTPRVKTMSLFTSIDDSELYFSIAYCISVNRRRVKECAYKRPKVKSQKRETLTFTLIKKDQKAHMKPNFNCDLW